MLVTENDQNKIDKLIGQQDSFVKCEGIPANLMFLALMLRKY